MTSITLTLDTTGAVDCSSIIQAALDAAQAAGGGTVNLPAGQFKLTTGLKLPSNVNLQGCGINATSLRAAGAITAITYQPGRTTPRGSVQWLSVWGIDAVGAPGNTQTSAVGIQVSDCAGFLLHEVRVSGFRAGTGVLLHNIGAWTEATHGTLFLDDNLIGIAMRRTSAGGGTNSFGYTRLSMWINVPDNGIGIDIGSTGDAVLLYNAEITGQFWLGNNAIGCRVRATADFGWTNNATLIHLTSEPESGAVGSTVLSVDTGGLCQVMGIVTGTSAQSVIAGRAVIGREQRVVKATDQSVTSSTALIDDAELQIYLPFASLWRIDGVIFFQSSTAGDLKYDFAGPANATGPVWGLGATSTTTSATAAASFINQQVQLTGSLAAGGIDATPMSMKVEGLVTTTSSGGIFKLQWAQQASDPTPTVVRAGSWLRAVRVA